MKIAVLDDYQNVAAGLADWASLGAEVVFFHDTVAGPALIERLAPFDVVCLMRERTPFPAEVIYALPQLTLIVTTGMRNLSIDLEAAAAQGVLVSGTAGRAPATAQHAMGLIYAANRRLLVEAGAMGRGGWQTSLGRDLHGLTLGLIGLGRLGAAVAALAKPFGMEIIAWSQNLSAERCAEIGVGRASSLTALLAAADVASVHLVLSERSRGLIGAEALAAMKPDAVLVNTSRGPILDSAAVLAALNADQLGAAALDVFDDEPLAADHPLRDQALIDAGKLLLTPHIGYASRQTYALFYRETVECVAAFAAGAPIRVLGG